MQSKISPLALARASLVLAATLVGVCVHAATSPAMSAFDRGDFPVASSMFEQEREQWQREPQWRLRAGRLALYEGRIESAEALLGPLRSDPRMEADVRIDLEQVETLRAMVRPGDAQDFDDRIKFISIEPVPLLSLSLPDGSSATFMLDTGAPGFIIDPSLVERLGLRKDVGRLDGVLAGGKAAQFESVTLPEITLGSQKQRAIRALIMPMESTPAPCGVKVDGILGMQVLAQYLSTIDYARGELRLRPRNKEVPVPPRAAHTKIWWVPDHFIFAAATVNGRWAGIYNIDTGGEGIGIQMTKPALDRAHIAPDRRHPKAFATPTGDVEVLPFSAKVSIGGASPKRVDGAYFPSGDQYGIFPFQVSGTVTHQYFQGKAVTFDFQRMRMWTE